MENIRMPNALFGKDPKHHAIRSPKFSADSRDVPRSTVLAMGRDPLPWQLERPLEGEDHVLEQLALWAEREASPGTSQWVRPSSGGPAWTGVPAGSVDAGSSPGRRSTVPTRVSQQTSHRGTGCSRPPPALLAAQTKLRIWKCSDPGVSPQSPASPVPLLPRQALPEFKNPPPFVCCVTADGGSREWAQAAGLAPRAPGHPCTHRPARPRRPRPVVLPLSSHPRPSAR